MGQALVIAGIGGIARGFLSVATELCRSFDDILLLDNCEQPDWKHYCPQGQFLLFNVQKTDALSMLLSSLTRFVFVNLCTATDNVEIRKVVARSGGAYIDTAGSMIGDTGEGRDSLLLPYTFTPVESSYPQLVCCGINPGMVELLTRYVLHHSRDEVKWFNFESFEYDTLEADCGGAQPVSWCKQRLVDEIVATPSSERINGEYLEGAVDSAAHLQMQFNGEIVPSRLVCHEEVWTLGRVSEAPVNRAYFSYAFREPVMRVLSGVDRDAVLEELMVPEYRQVFGGRDQVVVKVSTQASVSAFLWDVSHTEVATSMQINATQYQTAASLAVFLEWMMAGHVPVTPVPYCAADMPVTDWTLMYSLIKKYGVQWEPVNPALFSLVGD